MLDAAQDVLDELKAALDADGEPESDAVWIGLYRAQLHEFRRFSGRSVDMAAVSQRLARQGEREFVVREYTPPTLRTNACFVYFHGGGFIGGSLDTHDRLARSLAGAAGCKLIAIDYSLAPECPFPAAVEDCVAGFLWTQGHARALQIDARKIVVVGDSAGGLLAAAVAIACRDRDLSPPALQMSLYPNMDVRPDRDFGSMHEFDGQIVKLAELERGLAHYVRPSSARADPLASPLACVDLRGVASAWVLTCECDPLRDEGRAWVALLRAAGVQVTHREAAGLPHAILQMTGRLPAARLLFEDIGAVMAGL